MNKLRIVASAVADAFLAGPWTTAGLSERGAATVGSPPTRLHSIARQTIKVFPRPPLGDRELLLASLLRSESFAQAMFRVGWPVSIRRWFIYEPAMGPRRWDVPPLPTEGDLAAWLKLDTNDLDWMADCKGLERFAENVRLRRYRYEWIAKRSGGQRLLETPGAVLKAIQRRLLRGILDRIPPHDSAHGFRGHRSVITYATPHVGRRLVVRFDLANFFGAIPSARIFGLFHSVGYPEDVARVLSGLCTNRAPRIVARLSSSADVRRQLATPHLPQGSPTSPALANLCAFGLDVRFAALASSAGAIYTRYADDLAFSFDSDRRLDSFERLVSRIALDEGFSLNRKKTRVLPESQRQQLAGVVVNAHPNVRRVEYDLLKATLHNCRRLGPSTQARGHADLRSHLTGRVAWVTQVNPQRGEKLHRLLEAVDWSR